MEDDFVPIFELYLGPFGDPDEFGEQSSKGRSDPDIRKKSYRRDFAPGLTTEDFRSIAKRLRALADAIDAEHPPVSPIGESEKAPAGQGSYAAVGGLGGGNNNPR